MQHDVVITEWFSLLSNPTFLLLFFWFLKEMYSLSKSKVGGFETAMKENSIKLSELTISLVRLETRLESFEKIMETVPKLRSDVDAAHSKIREISQ